MKSITRIIAALAAIVLIAGCGGSAEPKKKAPAPKTYTAAQLEAAMPNKEDIPGAMKDVLRCPGESEICSEPDAGKSWLAYTQLKPSYEGSGADVEMAAKERWFGDTMSLNVSLHDNAAAADKAEKGLLAQDEKYDGAFDVVPEKVEGEGVSIGERGKGSIKKIRLNGWSGTELVQKSVGTNDDDETSEDRQEASVRVASGLVAVSVHVSQSAEGHGADDARKLAEQLVTEYLDRLKAN